MKGQRTLAYIVLIIISFFCLFWFYVLFINATRSNGALKKGFTAIPGGHLIENWKNLLAGTLPVWNGMFNSIFIATCSAVLCTYFSTMTAYAIHAYNFKAKKFMFTFILAVMMIPTQVTALGFLQLLGKIGLDDSFVPLIVPSIAAPVTFFYMKQYMESALPLSLIEAARIDGAGRWHIIRHIEIPSLMPTYFVLLVMGIGNIMNNGMEQYYLFSNAMNKASIEVLDLYVYNQGIAGTQISFATAVGMLKSLVGVLLLTFANGLSKLVRGESIF